MPNALIQSLGWRDRFVLFMLLSSNGLFWVAMLWLLAYALTFTLPVWVYAAWWALCVGGCLWVLGRLHDMKEPY
jgi:hypothetical protein